MEQERPKLTFKKATVPIKHSDGSYGFEEMWVFELYTPAGYNEQEANDLLKSFKKGTKPMTLKEELGKLYSESTASKRKQFLDNLPDLLRERAKEGKESITIYQSSILSIDLYIADLKEWCIKNGLDSKCVIWPLTFDSNITIYWG